MTKGGTGHCYVCDADFIPQCLICVGDALSLESGLSESGLSTDQGKVRTVYSSRRNLISKALDFVQCGRLARIEGRVE